ncbi:hypothetical protein OIV83_002584 [Microbotryomycetes sp. JL201]|nr:hypothetical protein OIV83_002584 [Microbotryomycetes sp. JL201]
MVLLPPTDVTPESVLEAVPPNTSSSKPHFLIFFASVDPDTGKSWCPDCRDVEPTIEQHVPDTVSTLVYVGQRNELSDHSSYIYTDAAPQRGGQEAPHNCVKNRADTVAGHICRWKHPDNAFRKAFGISAVPTILRLESSDKSSLMSQLSSAPRLVERDILDQQKLQQFLKSQ